MENTHRLPQVTGYLACLCIVLCVLAHTKAEGESGGESEKVTCAKGWINVPNQKTCLWFSFENSTKSWDDARDTCKQFGGDLVRIDSDELFKSVADNWKTQGKSEFWIGLNDIQQETIFKWLDDTARAQIEEKFWHAGEHTDIKFSEDCVAIGIDGEPAYFDESCGEKKRYICQASVAEAKDIHIQECGKHWIPMNEFRTCIWFSYRFMTASWQNARKKCQEIGGDLLKIENWAFKQALAPIWYEYDPYEYWIGLNDIAEEGVFKWLDETKPAPINKFYWQNQQPDNFGNEDCAVMGTRVRSSWNDATCTLKKRFICQTQKIINIESPAEMRAYEKLMEVIPCKCKKKQVDP